MVNFTIKHPQSVQRQQALLSYGTDPTRVCHEEDTASTVCESLPSVASNSSFLSSCSLWESRSAHLGRGSVKSAAGRVNATFPIRRRVSFNFDANVHHEDERDWTEDGPEQSELWWGPGEMEEMREATNILAGKLDLLERHQECLSEDSYNSLVKKIYQACQATATRGGTIPLGEAELATIQSAFRAHHIMAIGMDRQISDVRQRLTEKRHKLKQVVITDHGSSGESTSRSTCTTQNMMGIFFPAGKDHRLRSRCEAYTRSNQLFAECMAKLQWEEEL